MKAEEIKSLEHKLATARVLNRRIEDWEKAFAEAATKTLIEYVCIRIIAKAGGGCDQDWRMGSEEFLACVAIHIGRMKQELDAL